MYRHPGNACVDCGLVLHDGRCTRCGGVLIESGALAKLVLSASPALGFPAGLRGVPRAARTPRRRCPACPALMRPVILFEVPLDRCRRDGFWLGSGRLERLLANAAARHRHRQRS